MLREQFASLKRLDCSGVSSSQVAIGEGLCQKKDVEVERGKRIGGEKERGKVRPIPLILLVGDIAVPLSK